MNELTIFSEGVEAYRNGWVLSDCPYTNDPAREEWEEGWRDAEADDNNDPTFD